jgi:hypothetical protein
VKRRTFIAGLGASAWPLAAQAQQPTDRVRRIGVLMPYDENDDLDGKSRYFAFTQALAGLGWTDDRVRMVPRWGGGNSNRIRALAQELVGLQPDIILAGGTRHRHLLRPCRKRPGRCAPETRDEFAPSH